MLVAFAPATSAAYVAGQVPPCMGGADGVGVDPSADANVTAVWDYANALTDGDGVYQITDPVAARNLTQSTGSQKPAIEATGVQGDGTDNNMQSGANWGDVEDDDGYVIVVGLQSPSSISTNFTPAPNQFQNEAVLSANNGTQNAFYFRSAGPVMGAIHYDNTATENGVEVSIALSTWYAAAIRYDGTDFGITLDGITWQAATVPSLHSSTLTLPVNFLRNYSPGYTTAVVSYVAIMDATKSDAEVQDFLAWITENKLP